MTKEFDLSSKMNEHKAFFIGFDSKYCLQELDEITKDVKEFIRLLKETLRFINDEYPNIYYKIDKLSGAELRG